MSSEPDVPQRLAASTVYDIVRREGEAELERPIVSLWWSGVAAGIAISASLFARAILRERLPDTPARPLIDAFGYSVGFLIAILGRLQLFTENTITVVLPLLAKPSRRKAARAARLWAIVLIANFCGTFAAVVVAYYGHLVPPETMTVAGYLAQDFAGKTPLQAFMHAIPAGFLIAAIVWMLPSAKGSEFWLIVTLTYVIAAGDMAHVIVGSAEVFALVIDGQLSPLSGFGELLVPALVGNVAGGSALFAALAYAQVRNEM